MKPFHLVLLIFFIALLAGCNGTLKTVHADENLPGYIKVNSGFPAPYIFQGSGIQWNEDYAVSAAHIPLLPNIVHKCSTGCDLVFIKHKTKKETPNWRKSRIGENIKTVGASPLHATLMGEGQSKAIKVNLDRKDDDTKYSLTDAPVIKGMSGGPVYGSDNSIIGMIVGIFVADEANLPLLNNSKYLSVYIPYEIILHEWKILKEKENLRLLENSGLAIK